MALTQSFSKRNYYTRDISLGKCNYPSWAINRVQNKVLNNNWGDHSDNILPEHNNTNNNSERIFISTEADNCYTMQDNSNQGTRQPLLSLANKSTIGQVITPYTKGIAKSFKHICGKYGIQVHFKGNITIKQVLIKPKDQDPRDNKSGVIYSFHCSNIACNEECIGETSKTLRERCKEHLKHPSPICVHIQQTEHNSADNSFNIIGREEWGTGGRPGPSRKLSM